MREPTELYGPPDPFRHLRRPTIEDVIQATTEIYSLSRAELVGERRLRDLVRPRQAAMYVLRVKLGRSYPEIGRAFGGRDHTTVLHGRRTIETLMRHDRDLAEDVMSIALIADCIASVRFGEIRQRLGRFYSTEMGRDAYSA